MSLIEKEKKIMVKSKSGLLLPCEQYVKSDMTAAALLCRVKMKNQFLIIYEAQRFPMKSSTLIED